MIESELCFTGNWFIDCGTMGFINLMEEIYGWDLDNLNQQINENSEKCFYVYFPFAYLFYHSKVRKSIKRENGLKEKINDHKKKIDKINNKDNVSEKDKSNLSIFNNNINNYTTEIDKIKEELSNEKKKLLCDLINLSDKILENKNNFFLNIRNELDVLIEDFELIKPQDHSNFSIVNPKKGLFYSFLYLFLILKKDYELLNLVKSFATIIDFNFLNIIKICQEYNLSVDYFISYCENHIKDRRIMDRVSDEFQFNENTITNLKDKKLITKKNVNNFRKKLENHRTQGISDLKKLKEVEKDVELKIFIKFLSFCDDLKIDPHKIIAFFENNQFLKPKKLLAKLKNEFSLKDHEIDNFEKNFYKKMKNIKYENDGHEMFPDSTINPFQFSNKKYSNIAYTLPLMTETIEIGLNLEVPYYLLALSFYRSFQYVAGKNILFYINNLDTCYSLNKKIDVKKNQLENKNSIFKITWSLIIDELVESKSNFALENMYVIEYEDINYKTQKLINVMFMDIDKFRANILIDDVIRKSLNNKIQTTNSKTPNIWLIEELIKNKPLYPHILNHIILKISKPKTIKSHNHSLLYALSTDVEITNSINHDSTHNYLFNSFFELELGDSVRKIKENYKKMYSSSKSASKFFPDDQKEKISKELIYSLKQNNAFTFMNIFLKNCVHNNKDNNIFKYLNDYIFNYILKNERTWHNYALAIIIGII
ncbi:hypothetical protein [Methanobrevibacter curvatus]|uniref:Uncharacterized protein n=1 Tax=Methanobrevibacter curvatus TaxID=49547 RepID=A0A166AHN5_9EURY|nr:hypothetical protein [Methanobrevibacter curvatus]KZX12044.1 hypothetical protein MBCUR_11960 [Methanobrevibacter curvatus]